MSYFSVHERPVFLHFLNREANQASGSVRTVKQDVAAIDALTVTHCSGMTANLSQMYEYAYDKPRLKFVIEKMVRAGILQSTSHSTDLGEFIASRQKIYSKVSSRYPMYFGDTKELERFTIWHRNTFSMTKLLQRDIFEFDQTKFLVLGKHALDQDVKRFSDIIDGVRGIVIHNPDVAVTRANIEKLASLGQFGDPELAATARIFSARYFDHYKFNNKSVTPSGMGMVGYLDDLDNFPNYDVPILNSVLTDLGLPDLARTVPDIRSQMYNQYCSDIHKYFVEMVNYFLIICRDDVEGKINTSETSTDGINTVRRMVINLTGNLLHRARSRTPSRVSSWAEFFQMSVELIEHAVRIESRSNTRFAANWENKMGEKKTITVMLLTATDAEDDAVQAALRRFGFHFVSHRSAGDCVASIYRRGPLEQVAHIRSSAGSVGSGGSELTVFDAAQRIVPEYIIAVGICFGLKKGDPQRIGDILVSEKVSDYEFVRQGMSEIRERGPRVPSASKLLSASRHLRLSYNEESPKVYHGEIISGLKLVDDPEFKKALRGRFPDAIGGEMEASGLVAAASRLRSDWILVKSICDWGEAKRDKDQKLAAENAAVFSVRLSDLIFSIDLDDRNGDKASKRAGSS